MLYQEFVQRTKYEPSFEEYAEIEQAYYEFDGYKDEFCEWFKKQLRADRWEREYQLRRQIRQLQESYSALETEYSELTSKNYRTQNELEECQNIANQLERELKKYEKPYIRYIAEA